MKQLNSEDWEKPPQRGSPRGPKDKRSESTQPQSKPKAEGLKPKPGRSRRRISKLKTSKPEAAAKLKLVELPDESSPKTKRGRRGIHRVVAAQRRKATALSFVVSLLSLCLLAVILKLFSTSIFQQKSEPVVVFN